MNSANLVKALTRPRGHRGPRGVGHVMIDGATRRMRPRSSTASLTFAPMTLWPTASLLAYLCTNILYATLNNATLSILSLCFVEPYAVFWKIVPNWWFCIKEEGFLALCNPFKLIYKKKFILIELANFLLHGFLSEQIELQIEFLLWDLCIMRCSTIFNTLLSPKNLVVCKTGQDSAELSNRNETRKVSQGK